MSVCKTVPVILEISPSNRGGCVRQTSCKTFELSACHATASGAQTTCKTRTLFLRPFQYPGCALCHARARAAFSGPLQYPRFSGRLRQRRSDAALRSWRQLAFPQHRWWRRFRASGTKSFLQLTHLRRPDSFIARHLHRHTHPRQTDLSRSEERLRREVNPPARSRYFYLESGSKSTDPPVTFIPPEEESFNAAVLNRRRT
jgi:hypothetical protein